MAPDAIEQAMPESTSVPVSGRSDEGNQRFANYRGVQWRVNLGILPSSQSSSVDELRRVTADSRRRYASLRRRILVDPHVPKDGSNSHNLAIDNPLSQNPDSTWGRFFHNAELEKTVDKDLSRLYPEHGSYFQEPGCQGMLRRILLLWCLRHPEYGYRQGMHELLAPLLYVLHVDVKRLSEVRNLYEDHFTDKFDGLSFQENDLKFNFELQKFLDSVEDENGSSGNTKKVKNLDELDPEIQSIVLLTDAYGAEGELGIVVSEKFMEHDAYCMFDALMSGSHGLVAMADFFAHSSRGDSLNGVPPVIEASASLYHLLSIVDSSLHSHLVELGVEPQYFALRWLRVLFGREFSLDNLLIVWDEIFFADNNKYKSDSNHGFDILNSARGALISAISVSMILYLRSSLLATETATSCLQRLLNFPEKIDLNKIIEKAKFLQLLALDVNVSASRAPNETYTLNKATINRSHSLSSAPISPKIPLVVVPDSYWEERWRVLHKAEEQRQDSQANQAPTRRKGWSEKIRFRLSRTESDPSSTKILDGKRLPKSSVKRSLLQDMSRQLDSKENVEKVNCVEVEDKKNNSVNVECPAVISKKDDISEESEEDTRQICIPKNLNSAAEEKSFSGGEENSSFFSVPTSPIIDTNYHENDSAKSSVASNLSLGNENDDHSVDLSLPVSVPPDDESPKPQCNNDSVENSAVVVSKERKLPFGKFQWFWKFGRNIAGEETSDKRESCFEAAESTALDNGSSNSKMGLDSDCPCNSSSGVNGNPDQNLTGSLRNLGQSMFEHIQVIETVFQQDRGQIAMENSRNGLVGKGQVAAMTALKELRKISNLLTDMKIS